MYFKKNADLNYLDIAIPQDVENLLLPEPSLLQFYKNMENRILWIDAEIDTVSLEYAKAIMQWNFEDALNDIPVENREPIKVIIFSPGGDLNVNNCLIDTITLSKTPVIAVNAGVAASSACFIFLACHKRYAFPTAQFLIHKGSGQFEGNYDEVVSALYNYQRQIEELGEYILKRTTIPADVFNENFGTDWYLSVEEAQRYGMIDGVIESLEDIVRGGKGND